MAFVPITNVLNQDISAFNMEVRGQYDTASRSSTNSIFGESVSTKRVDDISLQFQYSVPEYDLVSYVDGTGAITNPSSMCHLSTGTGTGTARIQSKAALRYRAGHEAYVYFTAGFTNASGNTQQRIGVFDSSDGFFIGYNGSQFGFTFRKDGVDTFIAQSSWNGNNLLSPNNFVLDHTKLNIYRITYGWLGVAPVSIEVSPDNGGTWVLAHRQEFRNVQDTPSILNPVLPITAEVISDASVPTAATLFTASMAAGTLGGSGCMSNFATDRFFNISSGEKSIPANTWTNLITIRNPSTHLTKTNNVSSHLLSLASANIGNRFVQLRFVRDPVVSGTPNFVPLDAASSVLEIDTAGTAVDMGTSGRVVFEMPAGAGASDLHNMSPYGLVLRPGETTCLAAFSTATSDVIVNLRERELF